MTGRRVLFLGATGIDKMQVLGNFAAWCASHGYPPWQITNFENQYLWPGNRDVASARFLSKPVVRQTEQWQESWREFVKANGPFDENRRGILLGLHGSFTRGQYGVRPGSSPSVIAADFQPDLVITLIADIYDMWWRTTGRANSRAYCGLPSVYQLLASRHQDVLFGDQVALACNPPVKNIVLAVGHPIETLAHCVNFPRDHRTVYLSFPIAQPKQLAALGNPRAKQAVSRFLKRAYEIQKSDPKLVLLCPLSIDELPLVSILPTLDKPLLGLADFSDFSAFARSLRSESSQHAILREMLLPKVRKQLDDWNTTVQLPESLQQWLLHELNRLLHGPLLFGEAQRSSLELSESDVHLIGQDLGPAHLLKVNRLLLEKAFPAHFKQTNQTSRDDECLEFNRDALRWSLDDFWPKSERMALPVEPTALFPEKQVRTASSVIYNDISWRDYRLVDQADEVVVFNPIFSGQDHMAGSVLSEAIHAANNEKPVFVYQDENEDPRDAVGSELHIPRNRRTGTMHQPSFVEWITPVNSEDQLLEQIGRR